ncbi:hypothetical protein Tco_0578070 [Tanacetum coccineum]
MALDASEVYIPLYLSLFTIGNLHFPLNDFCLDGGEASVPLFKAFLTVGPAGDWLTFQKRSGSDIRPLFDLITDFCHGQGSFAYPYPKEPFDEALWNRLHCYTFEAQTFIEPILYLVGLSSSWDHAPSNPSIFFDGEEMAFRNFMKKPGQNPSFFVSSDSLGSLMAVVGNMLTNESRILSQGHAKLKNDLVSLKSKKSLLEHEMSKVEGTVAASVEESHKRLLGELSGLQPRLEEADRLKQRSSVEKTKFVKDFLHYVVKKLFESEHFKSLIGDLQQKAITYGRLQALDKVHGLGDSWDFKDGKLARALRNFLLLRLPPSGKPLLPDVLLTCGRAFLVDPLTWLATSCESKKTVTSSIFISLAMRSLAMTASYSASLLVVMNLNFKAYVNFVPSGLTIIKPAPEPSPLDAPSRAIDDRTIPNYHCTCPWDVIVNGDLVSPVASASTGAESPIPLKTAEQKPARKNKLKAKSTLMLAIPNEHILKFHACKDAKSLWEAIKNRLGGNKESKKMQKTILKQNYENFAASSQEGLDKTYYRFQNLIIQLEIHDKPDLDTLSMDDLYNNLKVRTNETVNTAHSVSTASSKDQASTASYANDVMFSFFANQSNAPQLDYKDLE